MDNGRKPWTMDGFAQEMDEMNGQNYMDRTIWTAPNGQKKWTLRA